MIIDNENNQCKVHEWITRYTENGQLDIVTGYFTIGALAWLSEQVNQKITTFRLVLGDIVNIGTKEERPLDLLNENITIEAAVKLSQLSQQAVAFLKQSKVEAKTLEPNFCHAKCFLFRPKIDDDRNKYFISGSSNLTDAGIGRIKTHNVELNIAETGANYQFQELAKWFDKLWERPQAHKNKTILAADGTKTQQDFKQYLIDEIERIFIKYTPSQLYYKVLFELFGNQIADIEKDPEFNRQIGHLENSVVYNTLYDFQKKGVLSLIRMLQKYNGAILADAVGLGKTWSALAVMKFFQSKGYEIVLICPKKLEHNWHRYLKDQDSRFEKDELCYFIRFHTDMHLDRMERYTDRADKLFVSQKPRLFVIDESHNLRNDKANRYNFLMENILKKNDDAKVLLLSATPINNSLNDIRNQFKLMVQGNTAAYADSLGVKNLDYAFRTAQTEFNKWREDPSPKISDFLKKIPANFFTLTDSLIVARTRKMIEGQQTGLTFPLKNRPHNLFVTPSQLGNFESFEELFDHFPPMLSGYQPSYYVADDDVEEKDILHDEKQREHFLVKMMYILMVKRLESSWFSFYSTVEKIRDHHQNALDKIKRYLEGINNADIDINAQDAISDEDDIPGFEDLAIGKKRSIKLSDIDASGNLEQFKNDLKTDLDALDNLYINLHKFQQKIDKELIRPSNKKSADNKLEALMAEIKNKQRSGKNDDNPKVLIFTVYRDTAHYIYKQLRSRGFERTAMVSGTGSLVWDNGDVETPNFEPILERFSPFTKLYNEKEWDFKTEEKGLNAYYQWMEWVAKQHPDTYRKIQNPIDILIATDALSEGQNLQDADMVINYDIHWNPVRIIQRLGRIDRLGSPNREIFAINFWPSNNINSYLNLQGRIEERMAAMKLAGAEVDPQFSDSFKEMMHDETLDQRMRNRMMKQMETTLEDLEGEDNFGFDDLSLERYRQDLLEEYNKDKEKYRRMPKGVYTGFKALKEICPQDGIIALLGYPAKPAKSTEHNYAVHDLIYINQQGESVVLNQKDILDALTLHKDKYGENWQRYVPQAVENGEDEAIVNLVEAFKTWLESQAVEEKVMEDGTVKKQMGAETKNLLLNLKKGDKKANERIKENKTAKQKFRTDNFDLIGWFLVSV